MQSRSFFTFGPTFNVICDSLMVAEIKIFAAVLPPALDHLATEADEIFITEDGNEYIVE